ncbi:hypothetical protein HETIRDRAFT_157916 [Heterobasidion irregulare TC 32-1]|uniref:Nucleoporin Nup54 alpha-helical domain-containing protein n=1 Tax=Heterobasidion irregulare (strain TC 32-1) TaxID=747525 RepID=W4KC10_HETIT|nr:uncharacterized protein HETIRDRAFT_157916 [Heterobasidion irregulare TC 32-1]ETW83407.1 hypothetical protein HETIRDRAFT_157916 [Heterobasidion irregulare TC 32-1]
MKPPEIKTALSGFSTAPNAPPNGSLFGGQGQQTQQLGQSGGLFGGLGGTTQQQNQPGGGLLGGTNNNAQPAGGLFGAASGSNQQQGQPAGGLFGGAGGNAQPTGGLFGNASNATQSQPTGSLFGGAQQQTQPSGGLFGNTGQNQQQQPSSGLFGQQATNIAPQSTFLSPQNAGQSNAQAGGGLFGASNNQQGGSLFGSTNTGLFGQQQKPQSATLQQSQLNQPAAPMGPPPFIRSTKFNDLPDYLKKTFEEIEAHIQGRVQIATDLKQRKVGDEAAKGQDLIRSVHKDLIKSITTLQSDVLLTRDVKAKVDQTVQDTIVSTHIIDGFRNPQQQHGSHLRNHASFPLEFFTRLAEQMRRRLQWYKATIEQIERKLDSTAHHAQYTPQAISTTLEAQHASFIALANKTAALDASLQKVKAIYTQLWRTKTGSMRDPFNELDRGAGGEFGLEGLSG